MQYTHLRSRNRHHSGQQLFAQIPQLKSLLIGLFWLLGRSICPNRASPLGRTTNLSINFWFHQLLGFHALTFGSHMQGDEHRMKSKAFYLADF